MSYGTGIGQYQSKTLRTAAILTNSYVEASADSFKPEDVMQANQLLVFVSFTKGSLTSAEVKIEYSNDNSAWYQETFGTVSGAANTLSAGYSTMTASGNYVIISEIAGKFVRVSANGTGTVTSSSMKIEAALKTV